MDFFEKDGEIYKHVPAGGHGGGVTGSVPVKASAAEAAAFREANQKPDADLGQIDDESVEMEHQIAAAEAADTDE